MPANVLVVSASMRSSSRLNTMTSRFLASGDSPINPIPGALNRQFIVARRATLRGRSPNLVLVDSVPTSMLGNVYAEVVSPMLDGPDGSVVLMLSPRMSHEIAAHLPQWMGTLINYTIFSLTLVYPYSPDMKCDMLARGRVRNASTGNTHTFHTASMDHVRLRVGVSYTTIQLTGVVERAMRAGDCRFLQPPKLGAELGMSALQQATITASANAENYCLYTRNSPLWITDEQMRNEILPVYAQYT